MNLRSTLGLSLTVMICAFGLQATAQNRAIGAEIPLAGHLDAGMAARLHAALNDGKPHVLRVNSSGGEDLPALAMAKDITRNRVALIVDGLCAGPCANYLFLAAPRRSVQPGGLVIFSASAASRIAMVPTGRSNEMNGDYAEAARQEKQLLADTRISPAILLEPQLRLQTSCYSLTSHDHAGRAYVNYQAPSVGWTPSRAYLAHAGVAVAGFWPRNADQFQVTLQSAFPGGARGTIAFAGTDLPRPPSALLAQLGRIPECDTGLAGKRR